MPPKQFTLSVHISTENLSKIRMTPVQLLGVGSTRRVEGEFIARAKMKDETARRLEPHFSFRSERTSEERTDRFSDFVPNGTRQLGGSSTADNHHKRS